MTFSTVLNTRNRSRFGRASDKSPGKELKVAKKTSETLQRALDLVTEKAVHDRILQRYRGVGKPNALGEDHSKKLSLPFQTSL